MLYTPNSDPNDLESLQEAARQRQAHNSASADAAQESRGQAVKTGATILGTILGTIGGAVAGDPISGAKLGYQGGQAVGNVGAAVVTRDKEAMPGALMGAANTAASIYNSTSTPDKTMASTDTAAPSTATTPSGPGNSQSGLSTSSAMSTDGMSMQELEARKKRLQALWDKGGY